MEHSESHEGGLKSTQKWLEEYEREKANRINLDPPRWGKWWFDRDILCLIFPVHENYDYEIDLEDCTDAAEILDWIYQLQGKGWLDSQDQKDMLQAFEDLLNPQGNYCSFGQNITCDPVEILREGNWIK